MTDERRRHEPEAERPIVITPPVPMRVQWDTPNRDWRLVVALLVWDTVDPATNDTALWLMDAGGSSNHSDHATSIEVFIGDEWIDAFDLMK